MVDRAAVLDTNVLVPLLYLEIHPSGLGIDRRVAHCRRRDVEDLRDVLAGQPLLFTDHVLTEVSNLFDPSRSQLARDLHLGLATMVAAHMVASVPFGNVVAHPAYLSLGVTDTALLLLCLDGAILFSADESLVARGGAHGGVVYDVTDWRTR